VRHLFGLLQRNINAQLLLHQQELQVLEKVAVYLINNNNLVNNKVV
jgi:hypothetical protein